MVYLLLGSLGHIVLILVSLPAAARVPHIETPFSTTLFIYKNKSSASLRPCLFFETPRSFLIVRAMIVNNTQLQYFILEL